MSFQELETQRLQNRQAVHDRMVAVARAKEAIKQDMQVDMEKLKSKMKEVPILIHEKLKSFGGLK